MIPAPGGRAAVLALPLRFRHYPQHKSAHFIQAGLYGHVSVPPGKRFLIRYSVNDETVWRSGFLFSKRYLPTHSSRVTFNFINCSFLESVRIEFVTASNSASIAIGADGM